MKNLTKGAIFGLLAIPVWGGGVNAATAPDLASTTYVKNYTEPKEDSANKVNSLADIQHEGLKHWKYYPTVALAEQIARNAAENVSIDVDSELSETSENPVQNKVINTALLNKQDTANLVTATNVDGTYTLDTVTNENTQYTSVSATRAIAQNATAPATLCTENISAQISACTINGDTWCYYKCLPDTNGWAWTRILIHDECTGTSVWDGTKCTCSGAYEEYINGACVELGA